MATGDLANNVQRLRVEMRQIRFDVDLDVEKAACGDPEAFLPILHHAFLRYSRFVAQWLIGQGHELYPRNDLRFLEGVYKVLRQEFEYRPSLSTGQFFTNMFAERKALFVIDVCRLVRKKHDQLYCDHCEKRKRRPTTKMEPQRGRLSSETTVVHDMGPSTEKAFTTTHSHGRLHITSKSKSKSNPVGMTRAATWEGRREQGDRMESSQPSRDVSVPARSDPPVEMNVPTAERQHVIPWRVERAPRDTGAFAQNVALGAMDEAFQMFAKEGEEGREDGKEREEREEKEAEEGGGEGEGNAVNSWDKRLAEMFLALTDRLDRLETKMEEAFDSVRAQSTVLEGRVRFLEERMDDAVRAARRDPPSLTSVESRRHTTANGMRTQEFIETIAKRFQETEELLQAAHSAQGHDVSV